MWLNDLNETELVTLAQERDVNAHRGMSREDLYKIVLDEYEGELPQRPVNKLRTKIMVYVNDHWKQVSPTISCPARTRSLTACHNCTDIQAVECAILNDKVFKAKASPETNDA